MTSTSAPILYRIYDFNVLNILPDEDGSESDDDAHDSGLITFTNDNPSRIQKYDLHKYTIQLFGLNELGDSCSILATHFNPFFFVRVDPFWKPRHKRQFLTAVGDAITPYYAKCIKSCTLLRRRSLYGFDNKKEHKFIKFEFSNMAAYTRAVNLWYTPYNSNERWGDADRAGHILKPGGFVMFGTQTKIYDSNIPPVLKFIHIQDISSSGWIELPEEHVYVIDDATATKKTHCKYEYSIDYTKIISRRDIETAVPYNIMSVDIEASSSHGDFPTPIKSYLKLATNIVDHFDMYCPEACQFSHDDYNFILSNIIRTAFAFESSVTRIDLVFPKHRTPTIEVLTRMIGEWLFAMHEDVTQNATVHNKSVFTIEQGFANAINIGTRAKKKGAQNRDDDEDGEDDDGNDDDDGCDDDDDEDDDEDCGDDDDAGGNDDDGRNEVYFDERTDCGGNCDQAATPTPPHTPHLYHNVTATPPSTNASSKSTPYHVLVSAIPRTDKIVKLNESLCKIFPQLQGDIVTCIGSTFMRYGDKDPHKNTCIVLNGCTNTIMPDAELIICQTETEVLLEWQKLVKREDPHVVIGYNQFGFDYNFMFIRAQENRCEREFLNLSKNVDELCGKRDRETGEYSITTKTIKIASGTHTTHMIEMPGRLQVDLLQYYRKNESSFTSYKLDSVSSYLICDSVTDIVPNEDLTRKRTKISTKNMVGLFPGSYVKFSVIGNSTEDYLNGVKFLVECVNAGENYFTIVGHAAPDIINKSVNWCLVKDDVTPKDIFRLTNGDDDDRAIVVKYCIQDCNLVQYLFNKSDIMTGIIEEANICSVPINFIVMRGQGIKLTSLISKYCSARNMAIPVIEKGRNEAYEGALVLEPKTDIYLDIPVACDDYASLYPSIMSSENYSHDSKVWTRTYNLKNELISTWGEKDENGQYYDNIPGYEYETVSYDTYAWIPNPNVASAKPKKVITGHKLCRFVQTNDEGTDKAIMPAILTSLLAARKATRALIPLQTTDFMKRVLDMRQLMHKRASNSVYGGCGAKTSNFYDVDLAACTTSTGQLLLKYAKAVVEVCYGHATHTFDKFGTVATRAEYIYGDTDSVFFTFNFETMDGVSIRGEQALEMTIELSKIVGQLATMFLKPPHDLEYEKTYMPFIIPSKKRYAGILYGNDYKKGRRHEMGLCLKRRDSAPIVKDIYGGIIHLLLTNTNLQTAIDFLDTSLNEVANGQCVAQKLIITKALRTGYKNPKSIAHKVLADRISDRDPGNTPTSGDRIAYLYFIHKDKKALQRDRIETFEFIKENKLKIDYAFYITNQIMKPVQQLFALVLEKLWTMQGKFLIKNREFTKLVAKFAKTPKYTSDPKKLKEKIIKLRNVEIKKLLFDKHLVKTTNATNNQRSITGFFAKPSAATPST